MKKENLDDLAKIKNVTSIKLDVTNNNDIEEAFSLIHKQGTGLFALINNAGISIPGPLMELSDEDLQNQFNVNLLGVHRVTRKFFPILLESKGRIIMISSINGFLATPFVGPYSSSKFALEGYTDSLRCELSGFGVNVIIIQPGFVQTKLFDKGIESIKSLKKNLKGSIFEEKRLNFGKKLIEQGQHNGISAQKFGKSVLSILIKKNKKTRYIISENDLKYKFIKLLSTKMIDKQIIKEMNNPM